MYERYKMWVILDNDESIVVSQPADEEMETTKSETESEKVANSHSLQEQHTQAHESKGKIATLPVL